MTNWQGALVLFQHEIRRSWVGILITMGFFTYIAFALMLAFAGVVGEDAAAEPTDSWFVDFMFLTLLPNMAFIMNKTVFSYWKMNPYTRKIAYLRTMPISFESIVIARMLQLVVTLAVVGIYYFTIEYALVAQLRAELPIGQYVLFVLSWMGYALMIASLYMFAEQTLSGKMYFFVCTGCLVMYALLIAGLWWLGVKPVEYTLTWAQEGNGLPSLMTILIGIAVMLTSGHFIRNKLSKRSLLSG